MHVSSYPIENGLDHDDEDDEDDHVPVDVRVGVPFSLLMSKDVEGVLELQKPIVGRSLKVFKRSKNFVELAGRVNKGFS